MVIISCYGYCLNIIGAFHSLIDYNILYDLKAYINYIYFATIA